MIETASASFWHKLHARWEKTGSLLCVGLDSDIRRLPDCVMDEELPMWEFNRFVIESTLPYTCCYKPNLAFYLADGIRGIRSLIRTMRFIPDDVPVILDCKVGDIGSTMDAYMRGLFDKLEADAITINPLMGSDVLEPLLKREKAFVFALTLTSNPSASEFFKDKGMDEAVAKWMEQYPVERVGAVIGATQSEDLKRMRQLMPERLFLIPGIGAQGGDLEAVLRSAAAPLAHPRLLINSSRNIIFASSQPDYARAARMAARELHLEIQKILDR